MRACLLVGPAIFLLSCGGMDSESGLTAKLCIKGAQYRSAPIDLADQDSAPEVHSINTLNNTLFPGVTNKGFSGTVGEGSSSVLIGVQGDSGHWVVPVQDVDPNRAGDYTFSCSLSFAKDIAPGPISLVVRAVAKDGRVGPGLVQPLEMKIPSPVGRLVVSLEWDTQADLDLHLSLPAANGGVEEIWARKPTAVPRGSGATVAQGIASGYLDLDSNSQCVLDGRRQENIVFPESAPGGDYVARVDTFSLCGEATARWRLRLFLDGQELPNQRFGQSTEADTRLPHGQGAGVEALTFKLP